MHLQLNFKASQLSFLLITTLLHKPNHVDQPVDYKNEPVCIGKGYDATFHNL